jgi:hypothetical protein
VPFQWRNPLPQGNDLYDVTYANGVYVAVGSVGTIVTSTNGFNWQSQNVQNQQLLNLVSGGNGIFVAAGPGGLIVTSSDGTNWAVQSPPTANTFTAIAFGDSIFVLADSAGNIYASSSGTNWSIAASGASPNAISSIAYGNGIFVGAAGNGSIISPDGANWSFVAAPDNVTLLSAVVFANGYFFASAIIRLGGFPFTYEEPAALQSTNGAIWTVSTMGIGASRENGSIGPLSNIAFGNGLFSSLLPERLPINNFLVSTDFISWSAAGLGSSIGIPPSPYLVNAQTFGGGIFVGVGAFGTIVTSSNLQSWTCSNWFNQWLVAQEGYTQPGYKCALASSSNTVVAVGTYLSPYGAGYVSYPTAYVSTNGGLSWDDDGLDFTNYQNLTAVTWGNGTFVAVGGGYNSTPGYLLTSTDGVTWRPRSSGVNVALINVTFGSGKFVCVGASGTILTSPTAAVWTGRFSGASVDLNGVAYGGGQFIVAADGGTILSSTDSATWTGQDSTVTENLMQVAYGNGVFVGVGQSGTIVMSADGTNWSRQGSGVTAGIDDIIFNDGLFVAPAMVSSPSVILTSYDGVHWNMLQLASPFASEAVCPVPGGLLFGSTNFAIVRTGNLVTPQLVPSGMTDQGFAVEFFGVPGQPYVFQSSPDLMNWHGLSSFTNSQNPVLLLDSAALGYSYNFYRVVAP